MSNRIIGIAWLLIFGLLALVVAQPVGLQAQFLFGLLGITIMFVVKHFSAKGIWRQIFLLVGVVIVYRYLYWRVTSTLPQPSDLANFIPGVLLFIAELYSITMLAVNMVVVADPITRKKEPLHGEVKDYPTVDIYVPSYNEDLDIVGVTLAAARNIDYPADKLNVYLLDDGGSDQRCNMEDPVKRAEARERRKVFGAFCRELGVGYVTRARNEHAKAGNMNEALKTTKGELIVVFDADHAPSRDFLKKTVGYFQADPKLFLVQTPHQFLNPDPVEKNIGTFERMPSENEMFYHVTQKGLDKWNGSFFCGSAAVLRREALNQVGGFAGVSITEDCETAVEMHALGWNSAYVDEPMVAGFQPETFASFISQRSRWCQGMLQILILKGPAFRTDMKITQRLAYMSIMLNWLFPMSRFMFMIAPAFFILFDLHIYNASFDEFIAYTLFSLFASAMMQNYMFGAVRWPWMSELYEYVQCYHLSRAIVSVVLNPRAPTFDVTNKAETLENDYYSDVGWFHLIMFTILAITCAVGVYRMVLESGANELLYVVGFWAFFNLLIAGLGLGAVSEKRQRRRHYRMPYTAQQVRGVLQIGNQKTHVMIRDMAIGGLSFGLAEGAEPIDMADAKGVKARLHLVRGRRKDDKLLHSFNIDLRWMTRQSGTQLFGAEFDNPGPLDRRAQALLMYPTSEALAQYRKNRVKTIKVAGGTGEFLGWSFYHTIRGLKAASGFVVEEFREKFRRGEAELDVAQEEELAAAKAAAAPATDEAKQHGLALESHTTPMDEQELITPQLQALPQAQNGQPQTLGDLMGMGASSDRGQVQQQPAQIVHFAQPAAQVAGYGAGQVATHMAHKGFASEEGPVVDAVANQYVPQPAAQPQNQQPMQPHIQPQAAPHIHGQNQQHVATQYAANGGQVPLHHTHAASLAPHESQIISAVPQAMPSHTAHAAPHHPTGQHGYGQPQTGHTVPMHHGQPMHPKNNQHFTNNAGYGDAIAEIINSSEVDMPVRGGAEGKPMGGIAPAEPIAPVKVARNKKAAPVTSRKLPEARPSAPVE